MAEGNLCCFDQEESVAWFSIWNSKELPAWRKIIRIKCQHWNWNCFLTSSTSCYCNVFYTIHFILCSSIQLWYCSLLKYMCDGIFTKVLNSAYVEGHHVFRQRQSWTPVVLSPPTLSHFLYRFNVKLVETGVVYTMFGICSMLNWGIRSAKY